MRFAGWSIFLVLTLLWTAGAYVSAEVLQWTADALASGRATQAAGEIARLPVPDWMRFWIDPAWVEAMQSAMRWTLDVAGSAMPYAGTAAGWLTLLIWIGWGLGLLLLILGAWAMHVLMRPAAPPLRHA
jgi:hypothetical protein